MAVVYPGLTQVAVKEPQSERAIVAELPPALKTVDSAPVALVATKTAAALGSLPSLYLLLYLWHAQSPGRNHLMVKPGSDWTRLRGASLTKTRT